MHLMTEPGELIIYYESRYRIIDIRWLWHKPRCQDWRVTGTEYFMGPVRYVKKSGGLA